MIIAIDGPSGSGKGTVAKVLAQKLGWIYFDTGAMYRAVCWYLLKNQVDLDNHEQIKISLSHIHFNIKRKGDAVSYTVNEYDVTDKIRTPEVSKYASKISAYPYIREHIVPMQRRYSEGKDAIFEGRDMGTVVFPNADLKVFLEADSWVRAKRRFEQLKKIYPEKRYDIDELHEAIQKRDLDDSSRKHSPLKAADDAYKIDTSDKSVEQVIDEILIQIKSKLNV